MVMKKGLLIAAILLSGQSAHAEGLAVWYANIQTLLSSMKVMTSQQNVSAEKRDAIRLQSMQAAASASQEISTAQQVRQAWIDYGPDGQLSDPCYQMHLSDKAGVVVGKADDASQKASALVYMTGVKGNRNRGGVPGFFGATAQATGVPFTLQVAEKEDRHRNKYCSVAEAQGGYCQLLPNGMQSGDSDFSAHMTPGQTFGWDQTEAATDFVKNVAPVSNPKHKVDTSKCADPVCLSSARQQQEQEAMLSMARYSFMRFVESRTSQASGDAKQPVGTN